MPEPRYSIRRIENIPSHRVYAVQCLNASGVAIAMAATSDGRDFGIAVCVRDAASGEWRASECYRIADPTIRSINEAGEFFGWSTRGGRERALVGRATPALEVDVERKPIDWNVVDADERGKAGEAGLGQFIRRTEDGRIVCARGVIAQEEHKWFDNAPRCTDFVAVAANASGDAVGFGRNLDHDYQAHACLWRGGESFNLNDFVDAPDVHLREADAINDAGWIACTDGEGEPVILEPLT